MLQGLYVKISTRTTMQTFFSYTVRSILWDSKKYARWSEVSVTLTLTVSLTLPNLINSTYVLIIHHTYIESSYKTEKQETKQTRAYWLSRILLTVYEKKIHDEDTKKLPTSCRMCPNISQVMIGKLEENSTTQIQTLSK